MIPPDAVGRLLFARQRLARIVAADWRSIDIAKLLTVEMALFLLLAYLLTRV